MCVCVCVQVSQYTFAMCSYREKKAEPQELMQLEGYTVDYCDPQPGKNQRRTSNPVPAVQIHQPAGVADLRSVMFCGLMGNGVF